jgi:hypothetical protein
VTTRHPVSRARRRARLEAGAVLAGALVALAAAAGYASSHLHSATGLGRPLVVVAAGIVAVLGGGPVAMATLRLADPGDPASATAAPGPADPDVLHGGAWVGVLERTAVTASLLTGSFEGIALALAVKGLARYPELRSPAAAERFIIGTFTSVLWACGCAAVAAALRG